MHGKSGELQRVVECKFEMVVSKASLSLAIQALRQFHPYEEPALEVYELGEENILKMLDGIVDIDMEVGDGEHQIRMMRMMGGGSRGGARHDMRGERQLHERDISEEHQFMEELGMLDAVAEHLGMNESVALLGIHMIRDNLEGDMQLEALSVIIEETGEGTPTRNAAIVTTIQALLEMERNDEAAELMIELAVSNSN